MALLAQSKKDSFFSGPGGLRVVSGILTLVSGESAFDHGLSTVVAGWVTPIHLDTAVAVQALTITGLTIPTEGYASVSNGSCTVKSSVGASTIQVFVTILGM